MSIHFFFHETPAVLHNRLRLKKFLKELFTREGKQLQALDFIFCKDNYLLNINQSFLKHDTYTDIVTFDLSDPAENGIRGEIYISTERVKENADRFDASYEHELHRVMFHGALHLCGYRDKKVAEKETMRRKENENLNLYFNYP